MFNLDEALRNHLAQRQKEPTARFVAAEVATLRKTITTTTAIIQWLKEEGAYLYVTDNTLCFRPTDWGQLDVVSANWRALLYELAAVDQKQKNGSGR